MMPLKSVSAVWFGSIALALLSAMGCSHESRCARHLEKARAYFRARQYDKAEIEYLNVLGLDAQHPVANSHLGRIYYEEGKLSRATVFLTNAIARRPEDLEARLALGYCCCAERLYKEARDQANAILAKQPACDEAFLLLADASISRQEIEQTRQRLQEFRSAAERSSGYHAALGTLSLHENDLPAAESAFKQALVLDQKNKAAHLGMANIYWERNNPKMAEISYKTAAELGPMGSPWQLQYADFKIRTADRAGAKKILELMTKEAPFFLPAWNRLAELNLEERKFEQAAGDVRKVLVRDWSNFDGLMLSGRLKLAQHDVTNALIDFERLEKLYPNHAKVQYQIALAALLNNETAKAVARLKEAVNLEPDFPEAVLLLAEVNLRKGEPLSAIHLLDQFLKQRPRQFAAYLLLAKAHTARKDFDEVLTVYRKLSEVFPQSPEGPFLTGMLLLHLKKKTEARQAFEQALAITPDYFGALEQIVALDMGEKNFAAALEKLQTRLGQRPNSPELHFLMARIYYAQKDYPRAEVALLKAVELDAGYRAAYFDLARLYSETNKHQQALEKLQKVATQNPKDLPALMQIAILYDQMKNYPAARDYYEKVLAVNPSSSLALNNLAYLYSEHLGKLDRAYALARRARLLLPNDPVAADTLGWILYRRGEYEAALGLLQESSAALPEQPEVLFHLGMTHCRLKHKAESQTALRAALAFNLEASLATQANKSLAEMQ